VARGMRKYEGVSRSIFAQVAQRRSSSEPPGFLWTPAHLTIEEALERGCDPVAWIGNAWADYFAKLASSRAMIANVTKDAIESELQYHKATLDCISWAAARMIRTKKWTDTPPPPPPPPSAPRVPPFARLSLHGHKFYVNESTGEVRCINCCVGARTRATLQHLCNGPSRYCKPTSLSAFKGPKWLRVAGESARPLRAAVVAEAEQALESAGLLDPSPPENPTGDGEAAMRGLSDRGHDMKRFGRVLICSQCSGFLILPHGVPRAFRDPCRGPSKVPSTRDKQNRKLNKAERGLHPTTGEAFDG